MKLGSWPTNTNIMHTMRCGGHKPQIHKQTQYTQTAVLFKHTAADIKRYGFAAISHFDLVVNGQFRWWS